MLHKILTAAAVMAAATAANAETVSFAPGVLGAQAGETLIADFDSSFGGVVLSGAGTGYYNGLTPGIAAPPAGDTTDYLAVLNGGSATFTFGNASAISFDVGSVDNFNSVTLTLLGGGAPVQLSGSQLIAGANANGDQTSNLTNGRLTITGTGGQRFTGLVLTSSGNSFEIDNLAINAVPEAATWATMLVGFGAIGSAMRSQRTRRVTFA